MREPLAMRKILSFADAEHLMLYVVLLCVIATHYDAVLCARYVPSFYTIKGVGVII